MVGKGVDFPEKDTCARILCIHEAAVAPAPAPAPAVEDTTCDRTSGDFGLIYIINFEYFIVCPG